jgi:hypothetical protein
MELSSFEDAPLVRSLLEADDDPTPSETHFLDAVNNLLICGMLIISILLTYLLSYKGWSKIIPGSISSLRWRR